MRERSLERERLQWQVDELALLAPVPGEWQELAAEQKRLAHAATLIEGARGLADALADGDDAIADRLQTVHQKLKALATVDAIRQAQGITTQTGDVPAASNRSV